MSRLDEPWFEFKIEETDGQGVDARALSRLLADLSSAFYEIARTKLGRSTRSGPHSADEDALAAIRVLQIQRGSLIIQAAPPQSDAPEQLFLLEPSVDTVALEFGYEIERIVRHEPGLRPSVRRRVQTVMQDAAGIGKSAELIVRPQIRHSEEQPSEFRFRLEATDEILPEAPPLTTQIPRRLSGHAFMVDVEPGRRRVRLKLPDGRDVTLDVAEELAASLTAALDKPVEIESIEEQENGQVARRTAISFNVLPTSLGSDKPPKSIAQLEQEQRLTEVRPDYVNLVSLVWPERSDLTEFEDYLLTVRGKPSA